MIRPGVGDAIDLALKSSAKDAHTFSLSGEDPKDVKDYHEQRFHTFMRRMRPDLEGFVKFEWRDDKPIVTPDKAVLDVEGIKLKFEKAASHLIAAFGLIGKVKIVWNDDEMELSNPESLAKIHQGILDRVPESGGGVP